jgi:hypothetical protein
MRSFMDTNRGSDVNRFLTLYAWNEWHEGGILEPNVQDGAAYINQITAAFTVPYINRSCRTSGMCSDAAGSVQ